VADKTRLANLDKQTYSRLHGTDKQDNNRLESRNATTKLPQTDQLSYMLDNFDTPNGDNTSQPPQQHRRPISGDDGHPLRRP
jgi:hypothetical protein